MATGDIRIELPCPPHYDVERTMGCLRMGPLDPTMKIENGRAWRSTRTKAGPATFRLHAVDERLRLDAWGPGADWIGEHANALTGLLDRPEEFCPEDPALRQHWRRHGTPHLPQSLNLVESLVPTIFQQLVTWREAMRTVRLMVASHGEDAPGPEPLRLLPAPEVWARLPTYAYAPAGALARHARTVREVARRSGRVNALRLLPYDEAYRTLCTLPGVGPWTSALGLALATGHPDAVPLGDLHLPGTVGWALAKERDADDARMLELLAPFSGHRFRVIQLVRDAHLGPPRRGPRRPMRPLPR